MSRYTKKHYEDVARIVRQYTSARSEPDHLMPAERSASIATARAVALDFADLFAADNPPKCRFPFGGHEGKCEEEGGFDRERFLAACGLEPARPYSTSMFRPVGEPGTGKTTGGS